MIVPWFAELDPNEESKTQQKPKTLFTRKKVGGEESWMELMAFLDFPLSMRKMIYTTNPVEHFIG